MDWLLLAWERLHHSKCSVGHSVDWGGQWQSGVPGPAASTEPAGRRGQPCHSARRGACLPCCGKARNGRAHDGCRLCRSGSHVVYFPDGQPHPNSAGWRHGYHLGPVFWSGGFSAVRHPEHAHSPEGGAVKVHIWSGRRFGGLRRACAGRDRLPMLLALVVLWKEFKLVPISRSTLGCP